MEGKSEVDRIINVYRCFNPKEGITPRQKLAYQLRLIRNAMTNKTVIFSDFNIDYEKIYDDNYAHKNLFDDLDSELSCFNLIQIVNFVTWSRMVGLNVRSSILDHIYLDWLNLIIGA